MNYREKYFDNKYELEKEDRKQIEWFEQCYNQDLPDTDGLRKWD